MATRSLKRFLDRVFLWVLIAGAGFMAVVGGAATWQIFVKERDAKHERDIAADALQGLKARQAELTEKLEGLSTERGLEEEIRSKFPLVKSGEEVIVIVNPSDAAADATAAKRHRGFWAVLGSWFSW